MTENIDKPEFVIPERGDDYISTGDIEFERLKLKSVVELSKISLAEDGKIPSDKLAFVAEMTDEKFHFMLADTIVDLGPSNEALDERYSKNDFEAMLKGLQANQPERLGALVEKLSKDGLTENTEIDGVGQVSNEFLPLLKDALDVVVPENTIQIKTVEVKEVEPQGLLNKMASLLTSSANETPEKDSEPAAAEQGSWQNKVNNETETIETSVWRK